MITDMAAVLTEEGVEEDLKDALVEVGLQMASQAAKVRGEIVGMETMPRVQTVKSKLEEMEVTLVAAEEEDIGEEAGEVTQIGMWAAAEEVNMNMYPFTNSLPLIIFLFYSTYFFV